MAGVGDDVWIAEGNYTNSNTFVVGTASLTLYGGLTNGMATLAERGVPAGAVRSVPEVFVQPEAARLVVDDGAGHAAVRTVATEEGRALTPPPRLGADTQAVLAALGLSSAEGEANLRLRLNEKEVNLEEIEDLMDYPKIQRVRFLELDANEF